MASNAWGRRGTTALLVGLALAVPLSADGAAYHDYGSVRVARVVSVYDGDSFRADVRGWPAIVGHSIRVRVAGVDTPELRDPRAPVRALAYAARTFTAERLLGAREVRLHHVRRGKYFRLVAEVEVDGEDLSTALLDAGLAKPYDGRRKPQWP